jgi:pantoate--beta-alanine ligase
MGALHEGHISLIRQASLENAKVAVSIFVNPAQFNNPQDLEKYPRNIDHDLRLLEEEAVNLVWTPPVEEVYPPGFQTYINVEEVSKPLEGASRPGHFKGVATVVAKLFTVFQPTRAYFGQKDAQQVAVIKRMARDLNLDLEIVTCPIVREDDGLAFSSRNARLLPSERQAATVLYRALVVANDAWTFGERNGTVLRQIMSEVIASEAAARIDYVSVADPETLQEIDGVAGRALFSMAVYIGDVRLIDNMVVE